MLKLNTVSSNWNSTLYVYSASKKLKISCSFSFSLTRTMDGRLQIESYTYADRLIVTLLSLSEVSRTRVNLFENGKRIQLDSWEVILIKRSIFYRTEICDQSDFFKLLCLYPDMAESGIDLGFDLEYDLNLNLLNDNDSNMDFLPNMENVEFYELKSTRSLRTDEM